jgi:hypothetical protein
MLAEDGLGLPAQRRPRRSWQAVTERGEQHPIGWRPLDPLELALEHLDLAPKRQYLSLELGLVAPAGGNRVEEKS